MDAAKGILTARRRQELARGGGGARHGRPLRRGRGAISINERDQDRDGEGRRQDDHDQGRRLDFASTAPRARSTRARPKTKDPDPNSPRLREVHELADEFRGNFGVRANADIPRDAKAARAFGAEGIGLCRTEHMFFAEDRLPHHAGDDSRRHERRAAARRWRSSCRMQRKDFAGLFAAMDGFPVVIRTLDPPLHEFLPKREELMVDLAKLPARRHQDEEGDGRRSTRTSAPK